MQALTRSEAKRLGLNRYFTGQPCPSGHVAERRTRNGECVECARLAAHLRFSAKRDDPEFRKANAVRSTRNYVERTAGQRSARQKAVEEQIKLAAKLRPDLPILSRKEALSTGAAYYFEGRPCAKGHLDKRLTSDAQCATCKAGSITTWRLENKPRMHEYNRQRYESDPVSARKRSRDWYEKHREDAQFQTLNRKRAFDWRKDHPEEVIAGVNRRRARKLQAGGSHTAEDIRRIRRQQRDKCAYCKKLLNGRGEVDHIKPLAPTDGSKPGTNHASNLQLLCMPCNRRKRARDPIDFAQSIGFLL